MVRVEKIKFLTTIASTAKAAREESYQLFSLLISIPNLTEKYSKINLKKNDWIIESHWIVTERQPHSTPLILKFFNFNTFLLLCKNKTLLLIQSEIKYTLATMRTKEVEKDADD